MLNKLIQPFLGTRQDDTPEVVQENIRKFSSPGVSVYGQSPIYHQKGWQVRAPLDGMTFMEYEGRRYAVSSSEYTAHRLPGHQDYRVYEKPVDHAVAKSLLVEFAPGQFVALGRYNPTRTLADTLNDVLPRDANGDPNGTLKDRADRICENMTLSMSTYEPKSVEKVKSLKVDQELSF